MNQLVDPEVLNPRTMETPNNVSRDTNDPFVLPPNQPRSQTSSVASMGRITTSEDRGTTIKRTLKPRDPALMSAKAAPYRILRKQPRLQRSIPRIPTIDGINPNVLGIEPVPAATDLTEINNLPPKVDKGWKAAARRMVGFRSSSKQIKHPMVERANIKNQKRRREVSSL